MHPVDDIYEVASTSGEDEDDEDAAEEDESCFERSSASSTSDLSVVQDAAAAPSHHPHASSGPLPTVPSLLHSQSSRPSGAAPPAPQRLPHSSAPPARMPMFPERSGSSTGVHTGAFLKQHRSAAAAFGGLSIVSFGGSSTQTSGAQHVSAASMSGRNQTAPSRATLLNKHRPYDSSGDRMGVHGSLGESNDLLQFITHLETSSTLFGAAPSADPSSTCRNNSRISPSNSIPHAGSPPTSVTPLAAHTAVSTPSTTNSPQSLRPSVRQLQAVSLTSYLGPSDPCGPVAVPLRLHSGQPLTPSGPPPPAPPPTPVGMTRSAAQQRTTSQPTISTAAASVGRSASDGGRPPSGQRSSSHPTSRPTSRPSSGQHSSWGPPPPSSATARRTASGAGSSAAPSVPRALHPAIIWVDVKLTPSPLAGGKVKLEVPTDSKGRVYPYVLPSVIPGAPPTFSFCGTAAEKQQQGLQPFMERKLLVCYAGIANSPVKAAFLNAGMRPTRSKTGHWLVCWGAVMSAEQFQGLHEFQRVNHFPGTWELGRKDYLYRNVYNMRRSRGEAFDIVPRFFLLPRDYDEFRADSERYPDRMYIQKPSNSSRGRGIRMVIKPSAVSRDCKDVLVQQYIHNPLLIDGFKFDMRIYAAVTCLDPLRLYVYHDGLARFATEQYSQAKGDLSKRCVHLTNYSVNKTSNKFVANAGVAVPEDGQGMEGVAVDHEAVGSKWSIAALRRRIEADGKVEWKVIWQQVHDILAKALIAAEPKMNTDFKMKVPHRLNCFEVWGFDIMLDDTYRAWLIEANTCPSLAADSPMDKRVKNGMVADVMHLVGLVPYDPDVYEATEETRRRARLTGLGTPGGDVRAKARTLKEAEDLDCRGMAPGDLPDIIIEAEAEYCRRGGWERVFPCVEDPLRYCDMFVTPRSNNITTCKYYAQKAGLSRTEGHSGPSRGSSRR